MGIKPTGKELVTGAPVMKNESYVDKLPAVGVSLSGLSGSFLACWILTNPRGLLRGLVNQAL